uniref:Uncharacterized protein n=1 Tax=Arundo donax TaxID=35708 RepID=A0A0A9BAW6_ARUDO
MGDCKYLKLLTRHLNLLVLSYIPIYHSSPNNKLFVCVERHASAFSTRTRQGI